MNVEQLTRLFKEQRMLDDRILENHNLKTKDLLKDKLLAFYVEVGELANETRCFKFWSVKPASEEEVILEEYVDGVHFLLSIGLDLEFNHVEQLIQQFKQISRGSLTEHFHAVIEKINRLSEEITQDHYQELYNEYLSLGIVLGFSSNDMIDAYFKKNQINHERQQSSY
ncbi:dimeric dUTPase (all-alpha-NTP-PPase superfamily) [Scopulibacillus daqui]|uniref:Dimeric dUTPase (All-alpha-NTP-PPase superfamily) n=1 Tax=Scopulibacillus daqui TaxID=1469162 RepID=A0ABS2PXJ7_9BACL|nr:dUTP diphosphatase [Scopulibacillus daqui]MBM7644773.1 dimeric dUTPase (all-alpha-NTP-PPase superfamily) [Scopulibacillus daqui]